MEKLTGWEIPKGYANRSDDLFVHYSKRSVMVKTWQKETLIGKWREGPKISKAVAKEATKSIWPAVPHHPARTWGVWCIGYRKADWSTAKLPLPSGQKGSRGEGRCAGA